MSRPLVVSLVLLAVLLLTVSASAQTAVPINTVLQNTNNTTVVVAFCNATSAPKDLEGWVGQTTTLSMVASLSGNGRQAVTFVVPPLWYYRVAVVVPSGGGCQVTIWTIPK